MAESDENEKSVYYFADEATTPDPMFEYPDSLRENKTPIIIDNGSFKCRLGWATDQEPRIIFKNVITKQRGKKDCEAQIGNDISNIEVVRWQLKTQFDRNLITQYDTQEQIFDYVFNHLGINTPGCVDHPVLLTEPVCNPNYCRQQMSELLFECYHVPEVCYGVDSMFSLYNNHPNPASADSLMISCGYHTTHILPVLNGRLQAKYCRRINMGGYQVDSFMQRLLQLKYPGHTAVLTLSRAEELVATRCYTATDYLSELNQWAEEDYYMEHVNIMELPHITVPVAVTNPEQQKERRENQIKRLKDLNARRREEKLVADQETLQQLLGILELADEENNQYKKMMKDAGYKSLNDLQMAINKLNNDINKLNNKIYADDSEQQEPPKPKKTKQDIKNQTLIQQMSNVRTPEDMTKFLAVIHKQRQDLMDHRARRKQRKADMAKRRTLASQQRMKIITELAQGTRRKKEDTFGANDDDWNVYKQINKDAGDSDSEAEQEKLEEYETILKEYDPEFKDPNAEQNTGPIDPKEYYRLYVGVERIRIPELMFQPSMMGIEQAGVAEAIDFVLRKYSAEEQSRLSQHVFLTGGCATFPQFKTRLEQELLCLRPFQSTFKIYTAKSPVLDAWYGARKFAQSASFREFCVTKQDYEEKGGEYLKEHLCSNQFYPTPIVLETASDPNATSQDAGAVSLQPTTSDANTS